MKKYLLALTIGCFLAVVVVSMTTPGSWQYCRLKLGQSDVSRETEDVISSLKLFSATFAEQYMMGGNDPEALNRIPAGRMIKRRMFLDLNNLRISNKVLVTDRDKTDFREVRVLSPVHAVAITDEDWFNAYQESVTRRPLSSKKFNPITVRYYLKKIWGKWIVVDYEIYSREDTLPPIPEARIKTW